jgi:hypothetical protein
LKSSPLLGFDKLSKVTRQDGWAACGQRVVIAIHASTDDGYRQGYQTRPPILQL